MKDHNAYVLSAPIRSGKTTALQEWVKRTPKVAGFLTPDVNGRRMFQNIEAGTFLEMEKIDGDLTIGKYTFNNKNFEYIENAVRYAWHLNEVDFIILDEIGPLEIKKNLGFHKLVQHLLNTFKNKHPNLIMVVRDYCLEDFKSKYQFDSLKILTINDLKNNSF